jgi:polysaccharide biosynthesis transport protein
MPDVSNSKSLIPHPDPKPGSSVPQSITIEIPANLLQQQQRPAAADENATVPLTQYLWLIWRHKWKVAAFVAFAVIGTAVVSSRLTPIYESTATIDVDRRAPTGIVGQESQNVNAVNDADQFLATQVKLIQSDSVLRPVVRKYSPEPLSAPSVLDQKPLETVSEEEAPVILKRLRVTRPPNTFILQISYRHRDPRMAANVANAVAESYVAHTWNIRYRASAGLSKFMEKQLEELKAKMEKSSGALAAFEREFNVINPEEKTSILSSRLLQLNTEYTNAQADRVRKEAAYNSVKSGSLESAFVSSQGDALKKLQERLNEAQEKFAQVKTQLGVNHPDYRQAASLVVELQNQLDSTRKNIASRSGVEYREAVNREQMIQMALRDTKNEFDRLNARSFEYKSLKQEAEGDKKLYEELIHKIRESEINAGFQNSSIRLADPALPGRKPVFPNMALNLALAFLFSSILAVGAVILSDSLDNTVHDPEQVARMGTQVIGSLPQVRSWKSSKTPIVLPDVLKALPAADGSSSSLALATNGNGSRNGRSSRLEMAYDEAVRSVRESILLSDIDHPIRTVLITSALPREGKSTFATNLAVVNAQQNTKTLLIDADMRRPSAHIRLALENNAGLTEIIRDDRDWKDLLQPCPAFPPCNFSPRDRLHSAPTTC